MINLNIKDIFCHFFTYDELEAMRRSHNTQKLPKTSRPWWWSRLINLCDLNASDLLERLGEGTSQRKTVLSIKNKGEINLFLSTHHILI
jgi:hypothetical protein